MDYFTILAQKTRLSREFSQKRLNAVRRLGDYSLYLSFDCDHALKLDCTPDMPCIHTIEARFMPVKKAQNWFPKRLAGYALESVDITPGDRVLTFRFESGDRLVFEMTGRHANIILVGGDSVILGTVRKVGSRHSSVREIKPGAEYQPPPERDFPDMLWTPLRRLEERLIDSEREISEALARTICAGSRLFAGECCARAGIEGAGMPVGLDADTRLALFRTAAEMTVEIEKGGVGASMIVNDEGIPRDIFPLRMQSKPDSRYYADMDEAVERYSRERERGLDRASLVKSIESSLNREEKGLLNTLEKVKRERGGAKEPEELERKGNTLLANIYRIEKGMESIEAEGLYGEGALQIGLDPTLDGPANAERYFTRARKLKEAASRADDRIDDLERRIDEVRSERTRLETVEDIKALKKMAAEHARSAVGAGGEDSDRPFPRRFMTTAGLEIIVGRTDKENDELLKWANRNDYWLHAQGVGGSHVILRTPGRNQQPDWRSVEQAAGVAAYYSKAKTSSLAPVACTVLKYVVKRRGQGPGQVTYTREKVVFIEPGLP